jgi:hypothetical protein
MATYRHRPLPVEAVEFKAGMEDGFQCDHYGKMLCTHIGKPVDDEQDYPRCVKCKMSGKYCNKPYIKTTNGRAVVGQEDMVITKKDGTRHVMNKEQFHSLYVEVVEEIKEW